MACTVYRVVKSFPIEEKIEWGALPNTDIREGSLDTDPLQPHYTVTKNTKGFRMNPLKLSEMDYAGIAISLSRNLGI
ncbi:MAG: hypothetical protein CXT67_09440 [Methanobacteriota archaeon]|nr:MAG: hypothetical protein CXT67_09440 [Euryarchaeota archaeon]